MKLTDRIYLVGSGHLGFSLTDPYDCHVYLIDGGAELALIDAGAGLGVTEIVQNIRAHGFSPERVRHLILTHAHADHAGGAAKLRAALNEPAVYLHAGCAPFLRQGDEAAISLAEARRVGLYPPDYVFEPCPVAVALSADQIIKVGDLKLQVIETPGHSIGHTSFLMDHAGRRAFFGGDLVFFGGQILLQNTWDCDLRAQINSLVKLRHAAVDLFLPGHLTPSLKEGQRHIDAALKVIDGLLVPANVVYSWA